LIEAIRLLCRKGAFSELEPRYSRYRKAIIFLQLLVTPELFLKLYRIYSASYLWTFVQKYIKNSAHVVKCTDAAKLTENI